MARRKSSIKSEETAQLVDKYVGTAYDVVSNVEKNLSDINSLAEIVDEIVEVATIKNDVVEVAQNTQLTIQAKDDAIAAKLAAEVSAAEAKQFAIITQTGGQGSGYEITEQFSFTQFGVA